MKYKNKSISIISLSFWDQSPRLRNWSNTFLKNGFKVKIFCYDSGDLSSSKGIVYEQISPINLDFLPTLIRIPLKSLIFSLIILYILVFRCAEFQNLMIIVFKF
jgi:hypothetical protein